MSRTSTQSESTPELNYALSTPSLIIAYTVTTLEARVGIEPEMPFFQAKITTFAKLLKLSLSLLKRPKLISGTEEVTEGATINRAGLLKAPQVAIPEISEENEFSRIMEHYAIGVLAYNVLMALRILDLPDDAQGWRPCTIIRNLLTVPVKVGMHARYCRATICIPAGGMRWWKLFLQDHGPKRTHGGARVRLEESGL